MVGLEIVPANGKPFDKHLLVGLEIVPTNGKLFDKPQLMGLEIVPINRKLFYKSLFEKLGIMRKRVADSNKNILK